MCSVRCWCLRANTALSLLLFWTRATASASHSAVVLLSVLRSAHSLTLYCTCAVEYKGCIQSSMHWGQWGMGAHAQCTYLNRYHDQLQSTFRNRYQIFQLQLNCDPSLIEIRIQFHHHSTCRISKFELFKTACAQIQEKVEYTLCMLSVGTTNCESNNENSHAWKKS